MDYNKQIAQVVSGDELEGFYLLRDGGVKTSTSGKSYFAGTLSDKTGTMDFKVWDYSGPIGSADAGKVIKIRGEVNEFRGALQMIVSRIRLAEPKDYYDVTELVPSAPINVAQTMTEVQMLVANIYDQDYRCICEEMLSRHLEMFRSIPAAKSVHHGFLSGLLMHTSNMLRLADYLASQYSDVLDRSLLIAGTLLHDFAKREEFTFSDLGIVTDYSLKGQLLGHLVMGAQEVCEIAKEKGIPEEKSVLLQHMILSHHGEPEHGAAKIPMCPEAELLSYIDLIDSRMEIYREVFENVPKGQFSDRVMALDKKVYHHN